MAVKTRGNGRAQKLKDIMAQAQAVGLDTLDETADDGGGPEGLLPAGEMAEMLLPEGKQIILPDFRLEMITLTIEGITPLICHRMSENSIEQIESKQQGRGRVAKPPRDPDAEFRQALYMLEGNPLEKGAKYGFPAAGIKKSMVTAGGRVGDAVMTVLRAAFSIPLELVEIESPQPPEMRRDMARLRGGASTPTYRPQFRNWQLKFPVIFNSSKISREQVVVLSMLSGFGIGLGAWRQECSGTFGQFRPIEVSEVVEVKSVL